MLQQVKFMLYRRNSLEAFFALVRAGLWGKEDLPSLYGNFNYSEICCLAEEQSVVGLVAAGIEHVDSLKVPQEIALHLAGQALQLEQRNLLMNSFLLEHIKNLRDNGIDPILMKGQGVAQCYERPLWRSSGDIDFLLNPEGFERAKRLLKTCFAPISEGRDFDKHIGFWINEWEVELHGSLSCGLSKKMDHALKELLSGIVEKRIIREWNNNGTVIYLPKEDYDVFVLFTHIIKHYYKGGVGLRQICDLSRLLWCYKDSIKEGFVKEWLVKMGLMTEWRVLSAYMTYYLGLPKDVVPLYDDNNRWKRKAELVNDYIIKVGNFGHNRQIYNGKHSIVKFIFNKTRRVNDFLSHARVFPLDSIGFLSYIAVGKMTGRYK